MKVERWGGWIALVANVGVVGGLVLLAVEVRHNSQVGRAQAVTNLLSSQIAGETAFMGEDAAAAIALAMSSPGDLTDEQILTIWAYLNVNMLGVQQTYTMHELGLASEEDKALAATAAADWLGFPFGRVWWNALKRNFPSELAADIDARLADADPHLWEKQLAQMKQGAGKLAAP